MGNEITLKPKKVSEWNRLLNVKTKDIFDGLFATVKSILNLEFGDAAKSGIELITGIGDEKNDGLDRRAYVLIYGAMRQALNFLVTDAQDVFKQYSGHLNDPKAFDAFAKKLNAEFEEKDLEINFRFFTHPDQLPMVSLMRPAFEEWMQSQNIPKVDAQHIAARLRYEFVMKLNEIWRSKEEYFKPLQKEVQEHFRLPRLRGRFLYNQSLIARWSERMFDETFGLDAVYIPLNGCYPLPESDSSKSSKHLVVDAETHIWKWLFDQQVPKADFKTLVLRGGPGSGKSSLMKKVAKRLAEECDRPVYFVQLQWFRFEGGFEAGIKTVIQKVLYLSDEEDPFDKQAVGEACKPIFIFDGLDELSRSGPMGEATASDFIIKLKSTFGEYNQRAGWDVRAIVTGRDFVIQKAAEPTHAAQGQVLELLPYFIAKRESRQLQVDEDWSRYAWHDPAQLLAADRRGEWWKRYQVAKGQSVVGIPDTIKKEEYQSLSTQPLLSYLLARAHTGKLLSDKTAANINFVYEGLVDSLRTREWGGKDGHKHTMLSKEKFFEILEEMAVTAWHHGDVRTTNLRRFEERCHHLKKTYLITGFDDANQGSSTKLVIAMFAKGKDKDRDGNDLVEFTHKSFGEYLVARRIMRLAVEVVETYAGTNRKAHELAMEEWLETCSQQEFTEYIWLFLEREVALEYKDKPQEAKNIQKILASLFSSMINDGFELRLLDEKTNLDIIRASRNAESSLLLTISAYARVSGAKTEIKWRDAEHPKRVLSRLLLGGGGCLRRAWQVSCFQRMLT
jgi:hypothetical protein